MNDTESTNMEQSTVRADDGLNTERAYNTLRAAVKDHERDPLVTLHALVKRLRRDPNINWAAIEEAERQKTTWNVKKWHFYAVRALATPGRFPNGGDRVSARVRNFLFGNTERSRKRARTAPDAADAVTAAPVAAALAVKLEQVEDPADWFAPVGLCGDAHCAALDAALRANGGGPPPHTVPAEKAAQRDYAHARIAELLAAGRRPPVTVYAFDDWLRRPGAAQPTLFTAELVARFGADRVRVWSPNLHADVIAGLRALTTDLAPNPPGAPWLRAGCGCWCACNARWAASIAAAGGLDVVFADCFGAFPRGAGRLMDDLLRRRNGRLLRRPADPAVRPADRRPVHWLWAVSDLPERFRRGAGDGSAAACALGLLRQVADVFGDGAAAGFWPRLRVERAYGRTMHFVAIEAWPTEWVAAGALPGFTVRLVHAEEADG